MATFVHHIACITCGSSDARAVYSDGSEYCFSCGATNRADRPGFVVAEDEKSFTLPRDLAQDFPEQVFKWIQPTGIEIHDLIRNGYFYSQFTGGLYRLLDRERHSSNVSRRVLDTNASSADVRWLLGNRTSTSKSQFLGSKEETDGYVQLSSASGLPQGRTTGLIVVEDSLSAIKCARLMDSIPLFGSSISNNKLTRIVKGYERVYIWLDSDKYRNAQHIAIRCKVLGKQAECIYTELDPKYLNANEVIDAKI